MNKRKYNNSSSRQGRGIRYSSTLPQHPVQPSTMTSYGKGSLEMDATIPANAQTIAEFDRKVNDLTSRGYFPLFPSFVSEIPGGERTAESMLMDTSHLGGAAMQQASAIFDCQDVRPKPVTDAGTNGLGYIPWGPNDQLPNLTYKLGAALPYTASALKHNIEVAVGYGPALMYRSTHITNGIIKEDLIPYSQAGELIRWKIREVRERMAQANIDRIGQGGGEETYEPGTDRYELNLLLEDYKRWEETDREWSDFSERNHLLQHYIECMTDMVHMGICFPSVGLSRGRENQEWAPKITDIGVDSSLTCRLEEMDNKMRINYVYRSQRWRTPGAMDADKLKIVALPALMPQNFLTKLRKQVETANKKKFTVRQRNKWFISPVYYPSVQNPYYPQQAWWSIFPSKVYEYASTLITDKATARANGTMWGKIIYIHAEYLRMLFDEQQADTPEKQQAIKDKIFADVNGFLRRRENNGKLFMSYMFTNSAGKLEHAVEIVDVPTVSNASDMKVEVEEIANIILFSCGTRADLIGASLGKSSNGGTFQRELFLLEQSKKAGIQRLYTRWLMNIYNFNGLDPKGIIVIRQPVLTTLDRNPTGIADNTNT